MLAGLVHSARECTIEIADNREIFVHWDALASLRSPGLRAFAIRAVSKADNASLLFAWSSQMSPRNQDHPSTGGNLPRLRSIKQATFELGIGRSALYELIAAGKLKTVKLGRRRLVPREAIEEFIAGLSG